MSVPTRQIRKLRLGETKEFSPSVFTSLVEEKALETKFSDPKSNVLSPPLGEIRQVTTNKAQSSTEPESIPGHDLCFSWIQQRKQSFAPQTRIIIASYIVLTLYQTLHGYYLS